MSLTYVTAFLKLYDRDSQERLEHVKALLKINAPFVVFVSQCYIDQLYALRSTNILYYVLELTDTQTYQLLSPFKSKLPSSRNTQKDTFEFLTLMSAKAELVNRVTASNPFQTEQFAWIDAAIFHVLQNPHVAQQQLERLCAATLKPDQSIIIPGCWDSKGSPGKDSIHWRFIGGLLLGRATSWSNFWQHHKKYLPIAFDGCAWEVNYWAYIEAKEGGISWFKADHNDSILNIPDSMFSKPPISPILWLTRRAMKVGSYSYPSLSPFLPTSPSFLELGGQQFLNVRYVNYTQTPEACYIINDSKSRLKTENCLFRLKDYEEVESSVLMKVETSLEETGDTYMGLEDVRLYKVGDQAKFVATQFQWSPSRQIRIAVGCVDLSNGIFHDFQVIEPPQPTGCEKNWIPIVRGDKEQFIYQWYPLQIGEIRGNRLEIIQTWPMSPLFQKVRGSSVFHEVEEGLIGVVHYSIEGSPRNYYHMLIVLNRDTLKPLLVSQPFVFGRVGIEFCIGFAIRAGDYQFWYSQHDRDPVWLTIPRTELVMRPILD